MRRMLALLVAITTSACASARSSACTTSTQCASPQVCASGQCALIACVTDSDCGSSCGVRCIDGRCEVRDATCSTSDAALDAHR